MVSLPITKLTESREKIYQTSLCSELPIVAERAGPVRLGAAAIGLYQHHQPNLTCIQIIRKKCQYVQLEEVATFSPKYWKTIFRRVEHTVKLVCISPNCPWGIVALKLQ